MSKDEHGTLMRIANALEHIAMSKIKGGYQELDHSIVSEDDLDYSCDMCEVAHIERVEAEKTKI